MSSEPPKETASQPPPSEQSGASKDLADGLHLMLSAAKKALKNVDPTKIEEVGRRALKNLETIDAKKVSELSRKAAKNLDPRKIEEVAEDAGRELLSVMERVAERVERIATGAVHGAKEAARPTGQKSEPPPAAEAGSEQKKPAPEEKKAEGEEQGEKPTDGEGKPRVRVGE